MRYRDDMTLVELSEVLDACEALGALYAAADAADAVQAEADRLALAADPELADSVPDDMERIAGDRR